MRSKIKNEDSNEHENKDEDDHVCSQVWVYAATQIYWSLGIGFGGMLTFGSFNTFRNNVHR